MILANFFSVFLILFFSHSVFFSQSENKNKPRFTSRIGYIFLLNSNKSYIGLGLSYKNYNSYFNNNIQFNSQFLNLNINNTIVK